MLRYIIQIFLIGPKAGQYILKFNTVCFIRGCFILANIKWNFGQIFKFPGDI